MSLGSLVNGTAPMRTQKVVLLPWGALFEIAGKPAVWVIDPEQHTVSLKPITSAATPGTGLPWARA